MTILTQVGCELQVQIWRLSRRPTDDPETYRLALGEAWEEALALYLTANGLTAYRPRQVFISAIQHQTNRDRRVPKCNYQTVGAHLMICNGRPLPQGFDPGLLRPYQRDLLVKVGTVKRLSVEVKALTPSAFLKPAIHVGCCPKWDLKRFRVDALVLINNATGEAFVAPGQDEWHRVRSLTGTGTDYAAPARLLSPLDAWIDATKAIYGL